MLNYFLMQVMENQVNISPIDTPGFVKWSIKKQLSDHMFQSNSIIAICNSDHQQILFYDLKQESAANHPRHVWLFNKKKLLNIANDERYVFCSESLTCTCLKPSVSQKSHA